MLQAIATPGRSRYCSVCHYHRLRTNSKTAASFRDREFHPRKRVLFARPCSLVASFHYCYPPIRYSSLRQLHGAQVPSLIFSTGLKMADARYCVEYAKTGRSSCKKCKTSIEKGAGRIGKVTTNPFSDDGGEMKVWYHLRCMLETLKRARATTKKIETPADLEGFPELKDAEKDQIKQLIQEFVTKSPAKSPTKSLAATKNKKPARQAVLNVTGSGSTPKTSPGAARAASTTATGGDGDSPSDDDDGVKTEDGAASSSTSASDLSSRDNSFRQFRRLCQDIEQEPSYNAKTKLVATYLKLGNSGEGFTGDVYLLVKLLLPTAGKKRVYNLQSKQIVKLFSQIFNCDVDEMIEDLEKGDVAETAKTFFEQNSRIPPAKNSFLTLAEVDAFLDRLTMVTKEEDQKKELTKIVRRCTLNDLKYIVRLIKHDLRINAGAKHVLDALDPNAYAAFQASNDLKDVVERVQRKATEGETPGLKKSLSIRATVMTPVKPMLAEACRSVAMAMKKCPNGMYAEIKYDGERVQLHKQGDRFEFFSRSLKPVQPHKVARIKDYLSKACPHGDSMILDSEVLMVDNETGKPLPFGTLGIHKRTAFKDASCCLFIFDILHFNGETLMERPICERRKLLEQHVKEVKNRIHLSEQTLIKRSGDLSDLMMKAIKQGLEGLVLKDTKSIYEPGKRHWLKMKKDYLEGGAMADTADLIVLGAYYGTGNKGGLMSVFLMGVYDQSCDKFRTVARCGNGHDDATIMKLQDELSVVKIGKDPSKVPSWLLVNKTLIPDFVVKDPKTAPVWEITGAEFTNSSTHTADGISIRFPRVTRIRDDKDWNTATSLDRLKVLFKASKETTDIPGLMSAKKDDENGDEGEGEEMDDGSHATAGKSPIGATGNKRKREIDQSEASPGKPPTKKQKPVCKYGPKCYQKNPNHREIFDHPWDILGSHTLKHAGITVEDPLLDIFTGVKAYFVPGTGKTSELKRYFVAYDGEVLEDYKKSQATYFISDGDTPPEVPSNSSAQCLRAEWVWDCLQQKQLLPIEKYLMK